MFRHAIPLCRQCGGQLGHQLLACVFGRSKSGWFESVQLILCACAMTHLMVKVRIERLPILELPLFWHYNLVLADGIIGGIAVHQLDGTYPSVVCYHPVHRLKGSAPIHLRHRVFLFQLLPQLWPNLFQVGLRHIEDIIRLQLRIDIILLPLLLRQQFIVLPLDALLCLLIDHRKSGEHHRERVFALQYRHTGFCLLVFTACSVELLYAVESAEARNPIALLLAMQEQ